MEAVASILSVMGDSLRCVTSDKARTFTNDACWLQKLGLVQSCPYNNITLTCLISDLLSWVGEKGKGL